MSLEQLTKLSDEIEESRRKLNEFAKNNGKAAIGAAFSKCFEPPTNLESIVFTAFTAYFNDGDPCYFRVHEPTLTSIDGVSLATWRSDEELKQEFGEQCFNSFLEIWNKVNDEELIKAIFGDHIRVTITKDEVTVESYEDHD